MSHPTGARPPLPPAGWYDDPAGSPQERYWEGTRWTRNLRDRPEVPDEVLRVGRVREPEDEQAPAAAVPAARPAPRPGMPLPGAHRLPPQPSVPARPAATADGVLLAEYWQRVLATLVDLALVTLLGILAGLPYARRAWRGAVALFSWSLDHPGRLADPDQFDYSQPLSLLGYVIAAIGFVSQALLVRYLGGTVGQLLLGLRVVPTGQGRKNRGLPWPASVLRSAAATAINLLSGMLLVPVVISWLRPLWHPGRQTWHDSVAHTQVVQVRGRAAQQALRPR